MRTDFSKYIVLISVMLFVVWTISCSGRPGSTQESQTVASGPEGEEPATDLVSMVSPAVDSEYKLGEKVNVKLVPEGDNKLPDSVIIYFEGSKTSVLKVAPWESSIPSLLTSSTGRKSIKAVAYRGGRSQTITRFVIVYSDVVPVTMGFRVVKSFPHDRGAFTQGLIYDKGVLYEGTGQETGSTLREVELETGKVKRQLNLDPSLFGEGITLYRDRIYQVTWTSKVGFIYDKADFRLISRIYYATQGWGLTTIGDNIVMSDGTNVLTFHEPEMFTVVKRIEVYDNEKKVDQLNELEYINGEIWANIWMSDLIARIDPATGKVNSYIDLSTLFTEAERRENNSDVLNGIAYDAGMDRIFVTGKRWPKLYEIRITD